MRIFVAVAAVIAISLAAEVRAAEVPATSRVDAVMVFLSGAEVARNARLELEQGAHTIVFDELPAEAVPGSIRVDGKATAQLDIESVDTRRRYVARSDQALVQAERKRIEDEIERLRDERGLAQGQQDAAQTQKNLLTNLAELPGRTPEPAAQPALPPTDWERILTLIATGMTEAQRLALEAEVKKRDLDRRIEELEKKLSSLAPARVEQTEVKVHVVAGAPLEAELTVRYQVRNASWTPRYDARLETGSKTAPPKLALTRRAEIRQRTGEAWDNVALQLSTTRPSANAAAPELRTVSVDFRPDRKAMADAAPAPMMEEAAEAPARQMRRLAAKPTDGLGGGMIAPEPVAIGERDAAVVTAPFQAVFSVPNRLSVPETGEAKRVLLQDDTTEPVLTVRTVPKIDAKAYLYAKLKLPEGSPLLPGTAALFRDGTYVGTGKLPVLSPGEEHELGFGADDLVRVRHAVVNEKRGETGLISSSRTDSRNYRITVKNMHARAVELVVHDQAPVSLDQDIKVDLVGPAKPTRTDVDDKRGVLAFESKLGPEEERVIEFGYRVTWPGDRAILYR
jgi:uncharacterized protein (TIGR02231 family)